jgi:hypothetical protein
LHTDFQILHKIETLMFDAEFTTALAAELAPKLAALMPKPSAVVAPRYLNLTQAAVYLSTTPAAVRGMLRAKLFPCRKLGTRVHIDKQDIDAAMDAAIQFLND